METRRLRADQGRPEIFLFKRRLDGFVQALLFAQSQLSSSAIWIENDRGIWPPEYDLGIRPSLVRTSASIEDLGGMRWRTANSWPRLLWRITAGVSIQSRGN